MIRIVIEALVVIAFGLLQIRLLAVQFAELMVRARQIVVSIRVAGIGLNRLLEAFERTW